MEGDKSGKQSVLLQELNCSYEKQYMTLEDKIIGSLQNSVSNIKIQCNAMVEYDSSELINKEKSLSKFFDKCNSKLIQIARLVEDLNSYSNSFIPFNTKKNKFSRILKGSGDNNNIKESSNSLPSPEDHQSKALKSKVVAVSQVEAKNSKSYKKTLTVNKKIDVLNTQDLVSSSDCNTIKESSNSLPSLEDHQSKVVAVSQVEAKNSKSYKKTLTVNEKIDVHNTQDLVSSSDCNTIKESSSLLPSQEELQNKAVKTEVKAVEKQRQVELQKQESKTENSLEKSVKNQRLMEDHFEFRIVVPRSARGVLIGVYGQTVRKIKYVSQVVCIRFVDAKDKYVKECVVEITGKLESCGTAVFQVLQILEEYFMTDGYLDWLDCWNDFERPINRYQPCVQNIVLKLVVSQSSVPFIIGRRGSHLKHVENKTMTLIRIDKVAPRQLKIEGIENNDFMVTIGGSLDCCSIASEMIMKQIQKSEILLLNNGDTN